MRRRSRSPSWLESLALACALPVAVLVAGCGEAVAKPKPATSEPSRHEPSGTPAAIADKPVQIVTMKGSHAVGALDRPQALRRFFDALARLDAARGQDDVRIVQFGDSHTAADIGTGVVRRTLQARFGDGGRGFVAIGKPYKRYLQDGVRSGMSTDWAPERGKLERGRFSGDGMYGLAGIGLFTNRSSARAWTDVAARTSRAEVAYLEQPGGGAFDVYVDGVRVVRISSRGERPVSAFRTFDLTENTAHQVEVRSVGDGDVRVFGVSLDRTQYGVVFDALGINGARITTPLQWNEQHFAEQLRHRAPSLVILAYGTNESGDDTSQQTYERHLVDALGRVARAVPSASCLLLGPPDRALESRGGWATSQKLLEVIASQRRVAEAAGCAFYDQFGAMGGDGAIAAWANEDPPRAQRDRVHLTREGYAQLGSSFAGDLLRAYAAWRRQEGLPDVTARGEPAPVAPGTLPQLPPDNGD